MVQEVFQIWLFPKSDRFKKKGLTNNFRFRSTGY